MASKPFVEMFPAIYSDRIMAFTVSAMRSQSYGPQHNDPRPEMVMVPKDVSHEEIHAWLCSNSQGGVAVRLLGTEDEGAVHYKPTQLALFFTHLSVRSQFVADFEIEE